MSDPVEVVRGDGGEDADGAAGPPSLAAVAGVMAGTANFTFGGGSATIAVIHRAVVARRGWIDADTFALCFALSRLTPGTNLLAFCAGIGWWLRRLPGAVVALLAASVPSTLLVVGATALFSRWEQLSWAQGAIRGAVAAAVAITVKTCWTIAHPYWKGRDRPRVAVIAAAAFVAYAGLDVPAIDVLLAAAAAGALLPGARA